MRSIGINTFEHAYVNIPYFEPVLHVPRDLMHVELEGTLKCHLYGVLYMAIVKYKWFTLHQFNAAVKHWPFPSNKRPDKLPTKPEGKIPMHAPSFEAALITHALINAYSNFMRFVGTRQGTPNPKKTLRWTAGEMLHLVTSSVEMIGQLLSDEQQKHPVWLSWIAHVSYFLRLMQTAFTDAELDDLEQSIKQAHAMFLAVPEFRRLWLPKHHFSLHFAEDIRKFGPARFYWCMRFESKNREHKKAAKMSSLRNIPRK